MLRVILEPSTVVMIRREWWDSQASARTRIGEEVSVPRSEQSEECCHGDRGRGGGGGGEGGARATEEELEVRNEICFRNDRTFALFRVLRVCVCFGWCTHTSTKLSAQCATGFFASFLRVSRCGEQGAREGDGVTRQKPSFADVKRGPTLKEKKKKERKQKKKKRACVNVGVGTQAAKSETFARGARGAHLGPHKPSPAAHEPNMWRACR